MKWWWGVCVRGEGAFWEHFTIPDIYMLFIINQHNHMPQFDFLVSCNVQTGCQMQGITLKPTSPLRCESMVSFVVNM